MDEHFWIPGFKKLRRAASGMASQTCYRSTYFSTPSIMTHEAYSFWNGTLFNKGKSKDRRREIDVSYKRLASGVNTGSYWFVQSWAEPHQFEDGTIFHLLDPNINQEIYGVPEYLSSLNSIWLNEAATLFRRKYYLNGSHAGFILYMNDAAHKQEDIDNLRKALKESKGPANLRNLLMYAPDGKPDGLQLLPLAEVAAKYEFLNIRNVTRDDQLAAQRTPPQLMGILPNNTGGFGDVEKAARVFAINELAPLQERPCELNEWAGEAVISFKPYELLKLDI
ncbi:phage portal protein [Serratia marcescens]